MKRRTKFAVAIVGLVAGLMGLVILVQYPSFERAKRYTELRDSHDRLSRALYMALRSKDGARIDLGTIVGMPWDQVFIFAPYTPFDAAQRGLPGTWSPSDHDDLHERDDICILAFFDHERLVDRFSLPRADGDFAGVAKEGGYPRHNAVFSIQGRRVVP